MEVITVTPMLTALTLEEVSHVYVERDLLEMELPAHLVSCGYI